MVLETLFALNFMIFRFPKFLGVPIVIKEVVRQKPEKNKYHGESDFLTRCKIEMPQGSSANFFLSDS